MLTPIRTAAGRLDLTEGLCRTHLALVAPERLTFLRHARLDLQRNPGLAEIVLVLRAWEAVKMSATESAPLAPISPPAQSAHNDTNVSALAWEGLSKFLFDCLKLRPKWVDLRIASHKGLARLRQKVVQILPWELSRGDQPGRDRVGHELLSPGSDHHQVVTIAKAHYVAPTRLIDKS